MDLTLAASIAAAGAMLLGVIIFFVIITVQEIKEFEGVERNTSGVNSVKSEKVHGNNPLLPVIKPKNAGIPPATAAKTEKKNGSDSDFLERSLSDTTSTVTLEMSHAGGDEFGSREKIVKEGQQAKQQDFAYDNPCMDPSAADCQV